jgi:serine/threonine protein kinase
MNIVETVDLVQDENQHWCEVMEFCPGGDLYAAIKKGGMSPSEVECCFKQILTGVSYLHSQGVAHRDIKPENLFFDTKGHLKVRNIVINRSVFSRVLRLVTTVRRLCIVCLGRRPFTCRLGFAAVSHISPPSSLWGNVSNQPVLRRAVA